MSLFHIQFDNSHCYKFKMVIFFIIFSLSGSSISSWKSSFPCCWSAEKSVVYCTLGSGWTWASCGQCLMLTCPMHWEWSLWRVILVPTVVHAIRVGRLNTLQYMYLKTSSGLIFFKSLFWWAYQGIFVSRHWKFAQASRVNDGSWKIWCQLLSLKTNSYNVTI